MLMNFYLSCLLAFLKTKNGILGFWDLGCFAEHSANEGVKETVSRSRRVSPGSWVRMWQDAWVTLTIVRLCATIWMKRTERMG